MTEVVPVTLQPAAQEEPATTEPQAGSSALPDHTIDLLGEVAIHVNEKDKYAGVAPLTFPQFMQRTVDAMGDDDYMHEKIDGKWKQWTFKEYQADALAVSRALVKLGATERSGVAIMGFNSHNWFLAFAGPMMCNCISTGVYTTNAAMLCKYQCEQARVEVVLCENTNYCSRFLEVKKDLPLLKVIVQWDGKLTDEAKAAGVITWEEFMEHSKDDGKPFEGELTLTQTVEKRMNNCRPGQCACVVFTSGTISLPKGTLISHDNLTFSGNTGFGQATLVRGDSMVSFLPLSHVAALAADFMGTLGTGLKVWFADHKALKGSLVDTLVEVRPTVILAVPRVWEKMQEKMIEVGKQNGALKKYISSWARKKGTEGVECKKKGEPMPWGWGIANALVFSKVKAKLGLDRCKCYTAASPTRRDTIEFFNSLDIPLTEIFGMSEVAGPGAVGSHEPGCFETEYIGPVMRGTEMKISEVDGELLARGRHVMMGYLNNQEETDASIDKEGWLHTGDLAVIEKGLLKITGRKKELIKTAGGENIPPKLIEQFFIKNCTMISQALCAGDRRKFVSVLFTLKSEVDAEGVPTDNLAPSVVRELESLGSTSKTVAEAVKDKVVIDMLDALVKDYNEHAAISRAQHVRAWRVLPRDFQVNKELTPTLKLKRSVVYDMYKDVLDDIYSNDDS